MSPNSFIGSIGLFAGNFEPAGWSFCDGKMLVVSEFPLLFSIIGTQFGGDGKTTFALPDLRGIIPTGSAVLIQHTPQFGTKSFNYFSDTQTNSPQPTLALNYCIALDTSGTIPSRNF